MSVRLDIPAIIALDRGDIANLARAARAAANLQNHELPVSFKTIANMVNGEAVSARSIRRVFQTFFDAGLVFRSSPDFVSVDIPRKGGE
jgi:hypothetical protein